MRSRRVTVVAVVAACVPAGSLVALAATPHGRAARPIRACAAAKTHALRLAGTQGCRQGERVLVWNRRGTAGARGPTGQTGAVGPAGAAGPAGAPGTARAYAFWNDTLGRLQSAKGVVGVAQGAYGPGDWCVTLDPSIDAATAVPSAAVEYNLGGTGLAEWSSEQAGCAGHPNAVQIWTLTLAGVPQDKSFTVTIP